MLQLLTNAYLHILLQGFQPTTHKSAYAVSNIHLLQNSQTWSPTETLQFSSLPCNNASLAQAPSLHHHVPANTAPGPTTTCPATTAAAATTLSFVVTHPFLRSSHTLYKHHSPVASAENKKSNFRNTNRCSSHDAYAGAAAANGLGSSPKTCANVTDGTDDSATCATTAPCASAHSQNATA